jgi:YbbR domain-containing protein
MIYHPFRHLGLKFLSVGIAVLLWLTVAGEPIVERGLRVPLELRNTPEELVVIEGPPSQVDVRVRGPSSVLSHLDAGDVVAMLDVDQARPGTHLFHLALTNVRVPFGVEVVQLTPTAISLKFETSGTKAVPVVAVTEGTPGLGFQVGQIIIDPPVIEATGPESSLKLLKQAVTEPVSIEGATAAINQTVTISVADTRLRLLTAQSVRVSVDIKPMPWERTMANVPVRLRNASPALRVRVAPAVALVMVRGPKDVLSALQTDSLTLYVDLAGLGPGRYNLPIRVEPPRDLEVVRTQPAMVSVTVQ